MYLIKSSANLHKTVTLMEAQAAKGIYNGRMEETGEYLMCCRWFLKKFGALCIYTHDLGMHDCGWWKNPDYNECMHLSLSFRSLLLSERLPKDNKHTKHIIQLIFREDKKFLWCESPASIGGKRSDVWHYRMFIKNGKPIMPRSEVYSKKFTEIGWKSFSELHGTNKEMDEKFLPEIPEAGK